MLKKTLGLLALAISMSAIGAPQSARHSKSLFIKQTIFLDGVTCTSAAVTLPAVIGDKNLTARTEYLRQDIAAQPLKSGAACPHALPGTSTNIYTSSEFPPVGLIDYADLKTKLEFLYAEEQTVAANYEAYMISLYGDMSTACYFGRWYGTPCTINAKQSVNNSYAGNPSYSFAIMMRNTVSDYSTLTDEVVKIATNYHMNYSTEALAFKQSVRDYLNNNGILSSFVDIETELMLNGVLKRAAATLIIAKNDNTATPGTYTGAVIVNPPSNVGVVNSTYQNNIDIKYTTLTQYPDFYNLNVSLLNDQQADMGFFKWSVPLVLNPITPYTSSYVGNAFDSLFPGQDPLNPTTDDISLQNTYPEQEQPGAICAMGVGTTCSTAADNVISIMRKNNAGTGTFTYYGRWELKPRTDMSGQLIPTPPIAKITENYHQLDYDLCKTVRFYNQLSVEYTVQRYVWKYDLKNDPLSGFTYRLSSGYPQLDKEVIATNPSVYTSNPTVGFFETPRDIETTDFIESWIYDSAIIDPLKWSLSATHDDIVASKPFTPPGESSPMPSWQDAIVSYAPTQIIKSNALPSTVTDPTLRSVHFDCASINEDQVNALYALQGSASGNIVSGSIQLSTGNTDGDACTVDYSVWKSTVPPTYAACTPVFPATSCTGPGPEILVVTPYTNVALANNVCDESCPIGGVSKICARPRSR